MSIIPHFFLFTIPHPSGFTPLYNGNENIRQKDLEIIKQYTKKCSDKNKIWGFNNIQKAHIKKKYKKAKMLKKFYLVNGMFENFNKITNGIVFNTHYIDINKNAF